MGILLSLFLSVAAFSLEKIPQSEDLGSDGLIEVQYSADTLASYKERRSRWGTLFSISYESMLPTNYAPNDSVTAPNQDGTPKKYQDLYGKSPVKMIQLTVGPKYNFVLGAISAELLFGYGQVADAASNSRTDAGSKLVRTLTLQKRGGQISYIMDNLFAEPYVAPYATVEFFSIAATEKNTTSGDNNSSTALSTAVRGGVLIQLNWLDDASALRAANEAGLNNTYLDLFASKYNTSTSGQDYNYETEINYGAGIRLEY